MKTVYFAKGTCGVQAPQEAMTRYGGSKSSVCVFANADGFPLEGYVARQRGPQVWVEAIPQEVLLQVWQAWNGRPLLPEPPEARFPTGMSSGGKPVQMAWPHEGGRPLEPADAARRFPDAVRAVEEYNAAVGRYCDWKSRWAVGREASQLWDAFEEGSRSLERSEADRLFGTAA